jgi:hypothetical protein
MVPCHPLSQSGPKEAILFGCSSHCLSGPAIVLLTPHSADVTSTLSLTKLLAPRLLFCVPQYVAVLHSLPTTSLILACVSTTRYCTIWGCAVRQVLMNCSAHQRSRWMLFRYTAHDDIPWLIDRQCLLTAQEQLYAVLSETAQTQNRYRRTAAPP